MLVDHAGRREVPFDGLATRAAIEPRGFGQPIDHDVRVGTQQPGDAVLDDLWH